MSQARLAWGNFVAARLVGTERVTPKLSMNRPRQRLVMMLVVACAVSIAGCSGDDDEQPAVELGADAVGWCLNVDEDFGPQVAALPVVDCGEPHTHEVYNVVDSKASQYPGFEALEAEAQVKCLDAFEGYVGISPFDSNLIYSWMVPTLASWEDTSVGKHGDRQIICVVGNRDGETLVDSVHLSNR